ncbi:hypothetical protein [Gloeobacter morelensis]|uniref:Uncharacterized protein n=1 Tax=Gloeobacter morelensis MG652769 TaxID=2781736 RepID=A0ABY3PNE3_9CYAN|nr:hypothetical protein [Gloeobacter morelensis]UFP95134.1 hypothetical protein ISF26_02450 [Gloeobacter morelensis MG652769]
MPYTFRRRWLVLALWFAGQAPAWSQPPQDWLERYQKALQVLEAPSERRFEQQIQTFGWQEGITTGEFVFRADGDWEANLTEGDQFYKIADDRLNLVAQSDRLRLYSEYIERPERVAPHAIVDLSAPPDTYRLEAAETTRLGTDEVVRVRLTPLAGGPLRELWLDPTTALPRRAVMYLSGVWGSANYTVDFQPVERYWLPERSRMQIKMNFWVPVGFTRRAFAGPIDIGATYRNYRFGDTAALPAVPTAAASKPAPAATGTTATQPTTGQPLGKPLELSVSTQKSTSVLAERIAQFNLNKPDLSNPLTRINVFVTLKMGSQQLLLYLFRFNSKQSLVPIEAVNSQSDTIKLFGTGNP